MILNALREGLGRLIVLADHLTRPAPLQRSPQEQGRVEGAAGDLALYQFFACPFCIKTRRALHRLNVPVDLRDAQKDAAHRAELLAGGGKIQVPCLRIEEPMGTRWLYESKAIIAYLEERFGSPAPVADVP
jgi:glutaredoxin